MIRQLNAYPYDTHQDNDIFRLGDLSGEETKTLVLELSVPSLPTLGEIEIARLCFAYDELHEEHVRHHNLELPVIVNGVSETDFDSQSPRGEVMKQVLRLRAGLHARRLCRWLIRATSRKRPIP